MLQRREVEGCRGEQQRPAQELRSRMKAAEEIGIAPEGEPAQSQDETDEIAQEDDRGRMELRQQSFSRSVEHREHAEGGDHHQYAAHVMLLGLAWRLERSFH